MKTIKITLVMALVTLFSFNVNAQDTKKEDVFKPSMKIEGRIMYDFNFLSAGDYSFAGNEFRRVRLAAKGKVTKDIGYKAEFDFAGGEVNFRDVYLKYTMPNNNGNLMLGSFTEPSSLDNMTSSKYITFFERSMMSNTQPFKYNAGIMYDNQKMFGGKMGLQLAYTFNGDKSKAFQDKSVDGGGNFIARVTTAVLKDKEKNRVVHLGVNYETRDNDSDTYNYKFRIENHMGDKITVEGAGVFENTSDIGFELATTFGPLSFQAEYEASSIKTNVDTYDTKGYYGFVSYFLTGEHRPYKNSSFGRVKPKKDFMKDDGLGAVELVARYSVMDFSNFPGVTTDDKIANFTIGFNWYLNKHTRVMYNYTNANFNDIAVYGDEKLSGHLFRFQIDF
jgi:phosphate-selective porin OprO/OprP